MIYPRPSSWSGSRRIAWLRETSTTLPGMSSTATANASVTGFVPIGCATGNAGKLESVDLSNIPAAVSASATRLPIRRSGF
jgi:hypothetical protein